jgi:SAM-dependent methyltransferase
LSLEDFVQTHGVRPNHVICTELIEHLEKPVEFIKSVLDLLADGGSLIFSTPNKKPNDQSVWNSESPPVHLWWFTYASLKAIARMLDVQFMHIPLNGFYAGKRIKLLPEGYKAHVRVPVFDEHFRLINPVKKKSSFRLLLRRWEKGLIVALRTFLKIKNDTGKSSLEISLSDSRLFSESLCGVYKKK